MRTCLDSLVTEKALALINGGSPSDLPDLPELKNVCAKVSSQLSEEIDEVCALLGVHKRQFLEAAFIDAVATANEILRREGVFEALRREESAT